MADILVVDDEQAIRESISMFLSEKGHRVHTADTVAASLTVFESLRPPVVILDIRLPDGNGLDVLARMRSIYPLSKVIMITAFQDMETTIEAMKRGAYDYIHKPLDADELEKTVADAIDSFHEDSGNMEKDIGRSSSAAGGIVGKSRAMKEIYKMIGMVCQNRAAVLITGETGTGKELAARRIHLSSPFSKKPFVTFDCSAVVDTLLESELFGHTKGAFTGAVNSRPGKIELAGDGTLFLDEIGELPLNLQGKLLGFLERKQYMRVGGETLQQSRCRVIAATNRDLAKMVGEKTFRSDLYYRLKVVTILMPPLRERLSDIDDLAAYFIEKASHDLGVKPMTLQEGALARLKRHPWTGNVRELENVIVAAAVRSRGSMIHLDTLESLLSLYPVETEVPGNAKSLSQVETRHIFNTLESVKWNRTRAAEILKISLPTLRKKIQKYHLSPPEK
jgi:two-component system response regulator AtoC